jgi:transcriptional regulator with XRE-family HTH domain
MTQLGANIARELKKLGITQGELSERSGVAASHISYMVRGHGNPTLATLESLADVFSLSAVELLAADSTSATSPERQSLYLIGTIYVQ